MARFERTGYTQTEISPATQAEAERQAQFNAMAFGGQALGGGPSINEITQLLRTQGRLRTLSPAEMALIERATTGGLARGFAPQLDAATNQLANSLASRGVRGSTGALYAGLAAPLAGALTGASQQAASMQLNLPFQFQNAGLNQAGAMSNLLGQQAGFAQFSLQRELAERQSNVKTSVYRKKRGFFSRLAGALGGALLGGLTGGIGTAVAGGVSGIFGGGGSGGEAMPSGPVGGPFGYQGFNPGVPTNAPTASTAFPTYGPYGYSAGG